MIQEEKQITDFVEKYNKQMDWNKDIRSNIKNGSKLSKDFIAKWLPTDKIDETSYELENAKVYPCDSTRLEMNVYSYKKYGDVYFWVNPNITEHEYKEQKIKFMREDIDYLLGELQPKIKDLVAKNNAYSEIREILVKLMKTEPIEYSKEEFDETIPKDDLTEEEFNEAKRIWESERNILKVVKYLQSVEYGASSKMAKAYFDFYIDDRNYNKV